MNNKRKRHQVKHEPTRVPITVLLPPAVARVIDILADDERTSASRIIGRMVHDALGIGYVDEPRRTRQTRKRRS